MARSPLLDAHRTYGDTTSARRGYHPHKEVTLVTVWFTVRLDDRPGSLGRLAAALGERGVNITGIVGVAEDTDGALMLTTSDPAATRLTFTTLGLAFEEHDPSGGLEPDRLTVADLAGPAR